MTAIIAKNANLLGAIVSVAYLFFCILIFTFRLVGRSQCVFWIGYIQFLAVIPLIFLLINAPRFERPVLYYVQIGLLLFFLLSEFLLDYLLKIEFRQNIRIVIPYVVLFFAATGGMLGVAALAGQFWTILSVILFLLTAVLAFVQRAMTGM